MGDEPRLHTQALPSPQALGAGEFIDHTDPWAGAHKPAPQSTKGKRKGEPQKGMD